jgi:anti-sigma factor RsiW
VRAWTLQNQALRGVFNTVLDEPVPAHLASIAARASKARFAGARKYAMAAGVFALGIALGWVARDRMPGAQASLPLARQAAIAHAVYSPEVRHPVEVGADQEAHLVAWLSKRLGRPLKTLQLQPMGYELVGGRLLSGPQGPVAQFMYQDTKGQRLTLYVTGQRAGSRDTAFRFSQEERVSVFYWIDGNYGYALSGEMGREPLLAIANAVYRQLNP